MGYELRLHAMEMYSWKPGYGNEIATIDMCKIGGSRTAALFETERKRLSAYTEAAGRDAAVLSPRTPDRQLEAVKFIRDRVRTETAEPERAKRLEELSNHIEDGVITKDRYSDVLPAVPMADVIAALEEDAKRGDYRRFKWALALFKAILVDHGDRERLFVVAYGH